MHAPRILVTSMVLLTAIASTKCSSPTGEEGDGDTNQSSSTSTKDKTIQTSAEAKAAWSYVKSAGQAVDRALSVNFTSPKTVSGVVGTASVSGRKTYTTSSSSSSSSSTSTSDFSITFTGYGTSSSGSISGVAKWYDYYYSRTACSSSYCASASDHSESLDATSLTVKFTYGGETYSDQITIDSSSDADITSWDVTVTTKAGVRFTFTGY